MSERDELAQDIEEFWQGPHFPDEGLVEHLLAAGYRKPRMVTTAEELDALPVGSVVLDGSMPPCSFQKGLDGIWWAGSLYHHGKTSAVLARGISGATVLHVGGER